MFGLGYVGAEDRLFFMDVLRHAGRGRAVELRRRQRTRPWTPSSGRSRPTPRPTSSARSPTCRSTSARRARRSSRTPRTTSRASTSTSSRPSSTRPSCPASTPRSAAASPEPFKPADIIATAVAGGRDLRQGRRQGAGVLAARRRARGALRQASAARRAFEDFRAAEDPEAPVTVFKQALPVPGAAEAGATGVARPDPRHAEAQRSRPRPARFFPGLPTRASNALLVAGSESAERPPADGRRAAGRLLQPADPDGAGRARARAAADGPGIDAQGAVVRRHQPLRPARPRARLRLERDLGRPGHHRHVRARALRRHALPLPRPLRADRGAREDQPLGADARRPDARPARRRCKRRAHQARARRRARQGPRQAGDLHQAALDLLPRGRQRRGLHGLQHARGGAATRRPSSARRRRSATRSTGSTPTPSTSRTSTRAPTRCARRRQPRLPGRRRSSSGSGWNPDTWQARFTPLRRSTRRPSTSPTSSTGTTSRRKAYRSSDDNAYSSTYRSVLLEDRVKAGIAGAKKMTLPQLIDAMEVAGHRRPARARSTCRSRCG